ncbi:MAG TPA: amylo-alpha-1,6-glucosidase [Phycisphaerae bacterium]|nr:amylo-alpha-1,6-glucosidase [Phycisphaerae bacterium]
MEKTSARNIYRVDRDRCADLRTGRHLEWLVTNGRGGFAMGTVAQVLTRRYHGLLVAAIEPPVERFVLLAKLDATAIVNGRTYELATNQYPDVLQPEGYKLLESFTARPHPTWRWRAGNAVIEQTLCMVEGEDTTVVRFRLLEGDAPVTLNVRPFCTSRHFHLLAHRPDLNDPQVDAPGDKLVFRWQGGHPTWQLSHNGTFHRQHDWYYRFFLSTENERGYDYSQDLFVPGIVTATLKPGDITGLVFTASTQDRSWKTWREAFARAAASDELTTDVPPVDDSMMPPLLRAVRDFLVVRDHDFKTVIAGYPWFGDWGRDTFISLPGLCLVPRRLDDARRIIQAFAKHVSQGMIPNRFPDFGEAPAYNTIDASLWYINAIDRYLAYSGDWAFIADKMFPVVAEIIAAYESGTRHRIRLCNDGLIAGGEPGLALTWMDAKLHPDRAITPRIGKPVEINALWYNALQVAASFADRLGDTRRANHWRNLAARTKTTFNKRFWNEAAKCLYDVVDANDQPGVDDPAIRPNQLFAISLAYPVLDESRWRPVVDVCERDLWTPIGLRTLSPRDPAYRGRYGGDLVSRDEAYHQGTVWPWLLGPFVSSYVKAHGGIETTPPAIRRSSFTGNPAIPVKELLPGPTDYAELPPVRKIARQFLDGLASHLSEDGIGSICEVADGDPPHTPGGCPWQAWSVAEPLRALYEDIYRLPTVSAPPPVTEERKAAGTAGRGRRR